MAGLATVQCVIMDGPATPAELLALQVVENLLREDLRPVEQARAYRALLAQNGWSIRQLAAELALDHSAVAKTLKLLDLPESVQGLVETGELPTWTAFEVAKAETPQRQVELARRVVAERLTASETAEALREGAGRKGRGAVKGRKARATTRVIRTTTGPRVTVEFKKGLDDALIVAALEEALSQIRPRVEAELSADDQVAA